MSQADRAYLRRLGGYEAEAHAERTAEHLAVDVIERLRRSLALSRRFRASANLQGRIDDPGPFYERARRLGLLLGSGPVYGNKGAMERAA